MTYVLSTIGDKTYLISERQRDQVMSFLEAGSPRAFKVGESVILLNQVSGIDPLSVYRRQMKHKLSAKGLRMCSRCHTIVPRNDRCPCDERPEKYPDVLEAARTENPKLAAALNEAAIRKALPPA